MDSETLIELSERELGERVARLETRMEAIDDIKSKLDDLLSLKNKGMGAFWFIGILLSSGMLGLIAAIINLFNKPHL